MKMDFAKKIEALRNKAQETQAANKIIDMLKDIESKNNNTTSYRWIWELIQNAKDVANSSGTVDILIEFDEKGKFIKFKHNGKLFSTKNIIFLIEQVSTKERGKVDGNAKKTTGKFGTGFLTTHLLSKKVNVSGYLQDEEDKPYSFNIDIDRSSDEQSAIISSIEESCNQLDDNSVEITETINEKDYNTCFTYHLDSDGIKTAKKGIRNLLVSAPYVFAFVPEINSITVLGNLLSEKFNQTIVRGETNNYKVLENAKVMRIEVTTNGRFKQRDIFAINDSTDLVLSLAVEVDFNDKEKFIKQINTELPKLFCDFPLLGTNDFSFPVVINSASFNPTEPRDGVYLTHKEVDSEETTHQKESKDIKENKRIMAKAVELYSALLDHFLSEDFKGIYHITKISEPPTKEWLSEAWIRDNLTAKLKSHIQKIQLIDTHSGTRKPLIDEWTDEACVLIPNYTDATIRNMLWNLSSKLFPDMITKQEEVGFWYDSLWNECRNFRVEDLIEKVEAYENLTALSDSLNEDVISWLKRFYNLIFSKEHSFVKSLNTEPKIIPNQTGDFCAVSSLCIDCSIEEKYKEVASILEIDIKSILVDKALESISHYTYVKKFKFDDMVSDILKTLNYNHIDAENFYKNILCLKFQEFEKQNVFLNLLKDIYYEDSWAFCKVTNFSNEIFEKALSFWIAKACKDVSSCGSILVFTDIYGFEDTSSSIEWLVAFTDYITKFDMLFILDRYALLPNQNGDFKKVSELNLDSGEIDDVVKDVCKIIGDDIREILLLKDIYYKMPRSRTVTNENISGRITDYIEAHKNKLGETSEEKTAFRNFYLYLSENRSTKHIETAFSKLCANLNWLYNDDDIAENMRIVETYNDILSKYGVSSVNELEDILSMLNAKDEPTEKIEISDELLSQWGISTEEELDYALANNIMGSNFIRGSKNTLEMLNYVKGILERSKNRIIKYLSKKEGYDLSNIRPVASSIPTLFIIKKWKEEIYLLARPSDGKEFRIYYKGEKDILDYSMNWEIWVEDGVNDPEKITFGKIIKRTGINRIPLTKIQGE